jgi:glucuronokinase
VRNFSARVTASESDSFLLYAGGTPVEFACLGDALADDLPGHTDGLERLALAALRRFAILCPGALGARLADGIALSCETTVPRQVGLAGSSAAIIATFRALMDYFDEPVDRFVLAEAALATEVEDLGIVAGPMDRVVQSYESVVLLDLAGPRTPDSYRVLDPRLVPPILVAWAQRTGRPSGATHSDLRARWTAGDPGVVAAMSEFRQVVDRGLSAMEAGDVDAFAQAVDDNYGLRLGITDVTQDDAAMVRIARDLGCAAKLCGSGGAVLIAPRAGANLETVEAAFLEAGFGVCRPEVQ